MALVGAPGGQIPKRVANGLPSAPPNAKRPRWDVIDSISDDLWDEACAKVHNGEKQVKVAAWIVQQLGPERIPEDKESLSQLTDAVRQRLRRTLSGTPPNSKRGRQPYVSDKFIEQWCAKSRINSAARQHNCYTDEGFFAACLDAAKHNGTPYLDGKLTAQNKAALLARRDAITGGRLKARSPVLTSSQRAKSATDPEMLKEHIERLERAIASLPRRHAKFFIACMDEVRVRCRLTDKSEHAVARL